jgi:lycopene beta-cyclase
VSKDLDLIIVGGGLAGGLAALGLAQRRPDVRFLLLEQGAGFGGNHVWSFFDSDVISADRDLIDPVKRSRWPEHEIHFPKRSRTLGIGYNSIRSEDFDRALRARLRPEQYRTGASIAELGSGHVLLDDGERIEASGVIDARGPERMAGLDLGWQKFVGRTYRYEQPHGRTRPVIMDAMVDQSDGYRFIYSLPFSPTTLMVEDTYYSSSPVVDRDRLGSGLDTIAGKLAGAEGTVISEETGVLPVLLGGDVDALWPERGARIARLGLRGGFFHPTTGYSLPDAVRNAALLCQQRDFTSARLHDLFHTRARTLWADRHFFQLLNRMLFNAAEPDQRYAVLEHFYRLPEPLVGRFYAAQLSAIDKLRIVSGRPPVPIGRALAALRGRTR